MKIIREIEKLKKEAKQIRLNGLTIGLVPTMGALHEGHLSLIRAARKENDFVVVSIFVNPAQFGPKEDFRKYPRTLKRDAKLCRQECADIIFYPDRKQMYPQNYKTFVSVKDLSQQLCGKSRPGHFTGVTTIVTKLFNIVSPDIAYFGQKDAQQSIIIKRLVSDLNMPVKIKVLPTVRQKDGLALSSRNIYLNEKERKDALVLYRALNLAKDLIKSGVRESDVIIRSMSGLIKKKKTVKIDYVAIVDTENLNPVKKLSDADTCLIDVAAWVGKTRLIDNIWVSY